MHIFIHKCHHCFCTYSRSRAGETYCAIFTCHIRKVICCVITPHWPPAHETQHLSLAFSVQLFHICPHREQERIMDHITVARLLQLHVYWSIISSIIPLPYLQQRNWKSDRESCWLLAVYLWLRCLECLQKENKLSCCSHDLSTISVIKCQWWLKTFLAGSA